LKELLSTKNVTISLFGVVSLLAFGWGGKELIDTYIDGRVQNKLDAEVFYEKQKEDSVKKYWEDYKVQRDSELRRKIDSVDNAYKSKFVSGDTTNIKPAEVK
jgi:hypothetical protein